MSDDRDDKQNTGAPGPEDFSLEEILAEFGGGPPKPTRWKEDTIPFPVQGRRPRGGPPPPPAGGGKVVDFPAGKREAEALLARLNGGEKPVENSNNR